MLVANTDPSSALELNDLRRALAQLPTPQREAIVLVGAGGMSYEEAADITKVAIGTIKSRVNRARTNLLAIIESQSVERDTTLASKAMDEIFNELETIRRKNLFKTQGD